MHTTPCAVCGTPFQHKHARTQYCSNRCGAKASYERRRDAGTFAKPTHQRTCVVCGKQWQTTAPNAKYCSQTCHYTDWNFAFTRRHLAVLKQRRAAKGTASRGVKWVQGKCLRCSAEYVARWNAAAPAKYCSDLCQDADKKDRRRGRIASSGTADRVSRWRIFSRDGYRCHLCRRLTDKTKQVPHPRAPTIDHIVPLALGGRHEPANCACACFICNSTKAATGVGDQLALIG